MPIKHQLTIPVWLSLSPESRAKIRELFNLKKSTGMSFTQAGGKGYVTSDGHTHDDLAVITVERIAEVLQRPPKADFWESFEDLMEFLEPTPPPLTESNLEPAKVVVAATFDGIDLLPVHPSELISPGPAPKKKMGRPKKIKEDSLTTEPKV